MRNLTIKSIVKLKAKRSSCKNRVIICRSNLNKLLFSKSLREKVSNSGGRNETGRITTRHRGGRNKRQLKYIDYSGSQTVYSDLIHYISSEYDSNRSGLISRVVTKQFDLMYRLSSLNQELKTYSDSNFNGNILKLKDIRAGSSVYNIEGKYCRAAGTSGRLLRNDSSGCLVRLSSKVTKWFSGEATASIGSSSQDIYKLIKKGKAGANRWLGHRPVVRGNAKNAVDHPNGGKTRGGQSKTQWGKQAKWVKKQK